LTGLGLLGEMHYTGTMESADIVVVDAVQLRSRNNLREVDDLNAPLFGSDPPTPDQVALEPKPRLGNVANNVHILNATIGTVMQIQDKATLSTGYVMPLRDGDDRYFDGELTIQLNVYR
ncbi:MAG: hypothetical protein KDA84_00325, partial [Planctomycetaceae bacterium]|nr:hypothetical protein [Planctomycetaceae bacterium]